MGSALFQIASGTLSIDWNPILWVGGIFLTIISGLLAWIGILQMQGRKAESDARLFDREVRSQLLNRTDKHEAWILQQQKDLNEMSHKTTMAIELIKIEQKQGQDRLKIFQDNFFQHKKRGKR